MTLEFPYMDSPRWTDLLYFPTVFVTAVSLGFLIDLWPQLLWSVYGASGMGLLEF